MARRAVVRITPELLAQALQLSAAYKPVGVYDDFARWSVCLVVEHPDLPDLPDTATLPELQLTYRSCQHPVLDAVGGGPA